LDASPLQKIGCAEQQGMYDYSGEKVELESTCFSFDFVAIVR
jgi:hypothetical protein